MENHPVDDGKASGSSGSPNLGSGGPTAPSLTDDTNHPVASLPRPHSPQSDQQGQSYAGLPPSGPSPELPLDSHPLLVPSRSRTPPRHPKSPPLAPPPSQGTSAAEAKHLSGPGAPSPEISRPLNVTDALTYLDAVKMQFQDKPDVYNHFLDIMKDFKSQMIDTPGVIERVSMLFHGNPYLIQGFNTFLPPGYRIELSNSNTVTVTTPLGVVTQNTITFGRAPREPIPPPNAHSPFSPQLPFGPPPPVLPIGLGPGSRPATPMGHPLPPGATGFAEVLNPYSSAMPVAQTAAAANVLGGLGRTVEKSPAGEFNHAIQFLNKIKLRFGDEPDTYKQFLEILQTYQKEQRQLHDSQVYAQVSMLFKYAPDLMEEFKDFLPEAMGPTPQLTGVVGIMPHPAGGAAPSAPIWDQGAPSLATEVEKSSKAPAGRRRKRVPEKEPVPIQPKVTKRAKHHHKPEAGSPKFAATYEIPPSPQLAHPLSQAAYTIRPQQVVQPHVQPLPPIGAAGSSGTGSSLNTQDELVFFDRVKKALESGGTYDEFLKLLNLFARDIIDIRTLVDRAEVFLGDGDLMAQFKTLMGWDEKQGNVEYGPPGSIRTSAPDPLAAQNAEDGESPSYRRLPESEVRLACSGRDQLHRSVLNDEWVSHPTWASEEAGFMTHKKNSFEDTLHKSEEERHEYQVHVEALVRTIAVLDPLNARISEMLAEERSQFRLKPNLGGPSRAIYEKMIRKVYGRDAGMEVIKALHECPGVAVPVVLSRLKQKCEEWRRHQREWSRTWREVDAKNFYKALDHQGITFKANDKRNITAKSFVQEIESAKTDYYKNREELGLLANYHEPCSVLLQFEFQDTDVLHDSLKMVYSFLDHSQSQYSAAERRGIEKFLRMFVPTLFMFSAQEFNAACGPLEAGHEEEHAELEGLDVNDEVGSRAGRRSVGGSAPLTGASLSGVAAGDLRKRLLKTAQEDASISSSLGRDAGISGTGASSADSPAMRDDPAGAVKFGGIPASSEVLKSSRGEARTNPEDVWIREMGTLTPEGWASAGDAPVSKRPFFANTTFYTLLRLLQLLYSRLLVCKETGAQLAKEKHASLRANPVAVELGLDEPNGPSVILGQAIDAVGGPRIGTEVNVLYLYLLDACEKVFENEMDQATFEEHMRWFFGTKAYHVFTLDRVITAVIKQVQTILGDHKGQELWALLQKGRSKEEMRVRDVIRYRREAERHVASDDHLYRIEWEAGSRTLRMQLVGGDEPSVGSCDRGGGRWREYVASFVSVYRTEWVKREGGKRPGRVFMKRNVEKGKKKTTGRVKREGTLGLAVEEGSCRLRYEAGTGECQYWVVTTTTTVDAATAAAEERRQRCRFIMVS